ncbi:MAG: GAF domain-containing sensor histidine kinase, partial [Psychrosphaera sp.]|nr:GAF domain-containing sensor histidine kinase [Psychrosphaera sp.]
DLPVPKPEVGGHTESVIYWPLTVSNHIIGVLSVQSYQKNAYDEHQKDMIQALASTTAIALDNARAYREVEQKSREVEQQKIEVEENHRQIMAAQQQLVQSEKMASLGTLTAGVAHEINNPTNFVHASAHILAQDVAAFERFLIELVGDDAEQAILDSFKQQFEPLYQHISTIKNGTERIKAIVQDLRVFTQLDSADKKLADVTDCLHSTVKLVKTQYLEVAEFIMDFQPVPQLYCYPAQLNQVFMNLIVNACDAIEEKRTRTGATAQGRIVIGCRQVDKVIEITVKDNGGGMNEQTQIKLFEPFYTTKDVGKGTGLGLSISYGIVQKHQGDLVVESELGLGSVFTLTLPVM